LANTTALTRSIDDDRDGGGDDDDDGKVKLPILLA
jgi:hypothetical protein